MIIGIPKGDLEQIALKALGLKLKRQHPRQLCFRQEDHDIILAKPKDMMDMVNLGEADVVVTCTAHREEWMRSSLVPEAAMEQKFGTKILEVEPWSLCLIANPRSNGSQLSFKVCTEFPGIAHAQFQFASVRKVHGSVEAFVACYGYTHGLTIVSTGKTLADNGLVVVQLVRQVYPCVIFRKEDSEARKLIDSLNL